MSRAVWAVWWLVEILNELELKMDALAAVLRMLAGVTRCKSTGPNATQVKVVLSLQSCAFRGELRKLG